MTTQAQIDALKAWYAQGASLINVLTPCDPPPTGYKWTQFQGAFFGNKTYKSILCDVNGKPLTPTQPGSSYTSHTGSGPNDGYVVWGTSSENHQVVTTKYGDWGIIKGFGNTENGDVYLQELVKADWTNMTTGDVQDISDMLPGVAGIPYCPNDIPASGTYRIREWFWAHNDVRSGGGRNRPCFWQATFTFGNSVTNPCWQTDSLQTRPAIQFSEAWWDTAGGWVYGTGTPLPWDSSNNPVVPVITYNTVEAFGLNAGVLWRFNLTNPVYNVGLATIT